MNSTILESARLPSGEVPACLEELHAQGEDLACPRAWDGTYWGPLELLRGPSGGEFSELFEGLLGTLRAVWDLLVVTIGLGTSCLVCIRPGE